MTWWQSKRRHVARDTSAQSRYALVVILVGGIVLVGQMIWVQKNQHRFSPFAVERIKCEECGSTGLVPSDDRSNSPLVMCPVCFGVGSHQVRRIDDRDVLCPACEGMGRMGEGAVWRTCRRCDGRGLVRTEPGPAFMQPVFELQPSMLITNPPSTPEPASPPDS